MLLTLPIPMITAILLGYLFVRALIERRVHPSLLVLMAACCIQSAIIALNLHYGVTELRRPQAIMANCIPPIVWLAFVAVTRRKLQVKWDSLHIAGPLLVLLAIFIDATLIDLVIPGLYLGYGVAMLVVLQTGEASIPRSNLGAGAWPLFLWRILAGALILSAASDALIGILTAHGREEWLPWIVSAGSSLTLLGLGALGLSEAISPQVARDEPGSDDDELSTQELEADVALLHRLDSFMAEKRPFLDPDLTLTRLARKVGLPAKTISAAINRASGKNVSRYVNRFRIEEACERIRQGANVTDAMLASGFNTKSNFNREFIRVVGQSPTAWRATVAK